MPSVRTVGGATNGQQYIFMRNANNNGALLQNEDILFPHNVGLLTYLQTLTNLPVPGFSTAGESFGSKYALNSNRDMILGEIFDYIRIANLADTTTTPQSMYPHQYASAGMVIPSSANVFGSGQLIGGFGRTSTIPEATMVFYCSGVGYDAHWRE